MTLSGTGKTYASAFALREMNPAKELFVVHREQIAKQALKSYKKVFGSTKTYGLLSGNSKVDEVKDRDFIFETMQMMSKPGIYEQFSREEFDICVLDEAHHACNNSYGRIMEYFKPKVSDESLTYNYIY